MPIYEYACRTCGHEFEALVFGGKQPPCPECQGADLEKRFSAFAVGSEASGAPSATCPATGGG